MKIRQIKIEDISIKDIEPGKYYVADIDTQTVLDVYYELISEVKERAESERCILFEIVD